jgi:hypothetical protein
MLTSLKRVPLPVDDRGVNLHPTTSRNSTPPSLWQHEPNEKKTLVRGLRRDPTIIKLGYLSHFQPVKSDRLQTIFTMQFTATSPQKIHPLYTAFSKTPLKSPSKQQNPGADRLAPGSHFFSVEQAA